MPIDVGPIDHGLAVRRAVIAHLKTDVTITAMVADRIYDEAPAQPVWPFIRYGLPGSGAYEATGLRGSYHDLTLHAFDKSKGTGRCARLAAAIVDAMEDLELSELNLWDNRWEGTQIERDTDEASAYHAMVRYRLVTVKLAS